MKTKSKSKVKSKEPNLKNIKDYAEWFRSLPEMESQIPVAFLDDNGKGCWHNIPSEIRETALHRAGSSLKGAMQKGFLSKIQNMLPIAYDEGGKHLWMESIEILRKQAGLLPTFDFVKTFTEDCQLVAQAIQIEIEGIDWDKDKNCISASEAKAKLKGKDFRVDLSLSWFTKHTNNGNIRHRRLGRRLTVYWPDVESTIEKQGLKNKRFMEEVTKKVAHDLLTKAYKK